MKKKENPREASIKIINFKITDTEKNIPQYIANKM